MTLRSIVFAAAALASFLPATVSRAQPAHAARQSAEFLFHYGIVPAEVVLAHAAGHEERAMHAGKIPKGSSHVVLALFETTTGQRISEAAVRATVSLVGGAAKSKTLEPMSIAGQASFGAFFAMGVPGVYKLRFEARRPGGAPASAEFEHRVFAEGLRQ